VIIKPFQAVITLSSRCGRTLRDRAASSLARAAGQRCSISSAPIPELARHVFDGCAS
jgi:hypothetical protein